mgnify:FL=1|tara:strand:+ start:1670 stop:2443 length:774 start_codon:yes stop_codon:yes gene_type:complete
MRIALCFSGTIGRLYTSKSGHAWEKDIDYRIGHHFYDKNVFSVNDNVDVFIHSWATDYEDRLVEIYNPKKSKFEEQIVFGGHKDMAGWEKSASRWYGAQQSIKLKKQYEEENNFKYDVVMWTRFDMGFFEKLDFSEIGDYSNMYVPDNNNPSTMKSDNPRILDYWYFSSSENMDIIGDLYDWGNKKGFGSPHSDIYQWPTMNNIQVFQWSKFQESWKGNGNTDLIRAIFDNCEYNENGFVGEKNLKMLTKYPKGSRF